MVNHDRAMDSIGVPRADAGVLHRGAVRQHKGGAARHIPRQACARHQGPPDPRPAASVALEPPREDTIARQISVSVIAAAAVSGPAIGIV